MTAAAAAAAAAADGADAAPNTATADPLLLRAARRSFKTLARAAAEKGGVDEAAAELLARSRESSKSGRMDGGDSGRRREQGQRRGKGQREEEQDEGDPEVDDHPVVVFVRQFSAMGLEQQVAKVRAAVRWAAREVVPSCVGMWSVWRVICRVGAGHTHVHLNAGSLGADLTLPAFVAVVLHGAYCSRLFHELRARQVESYARMEDRQLRELPYIDDEALAAVGALRQAAAMVEMMGWVPRVGSPWRNCKATIANL